ncbi:MAG: hypothetical protein JEZ08_05110 [Clostridiales bacterium]|nr:hypothetical protein [Clostridiales bacterium]
MDKKRLIRVLVANIIVVLVSIELPYQDKSLMQTFFLAFVGNHSNLIGVLCGTVITVVLLWSIREINLSEVVKLNGIGIFALMIFVIFPMLFRFTEVIKTPIYMFSDGVKSISMKESTLTIGNWHDDYEALLSFDMKYYGEEEESVKMKLILPDELKTYFVFDEIVLEDGFISHLNGVVRYRESIDLILKDGVTRESLNSIKLNSFNYTIVLMNDNETIDYIRNDFY